MINEKRLLDTFLEYVQIDSETKNEKAMGERLVQDLKALGFEVQTDRAGEAFGSNGFNVHAFLEGTIPGDPTILDVYKRQGGKKDRQVRMCHCGGAAGRQGPYDPRDHGRPHRL